MFPFFRIALRILWTQIVELFRSPAGRKGAPKTHKESTMLNEKASSAFGFWSMISGTIAGIPRGPIAGISIDQLSTITLTVTNVIAASAGVGIVIYNNTKKAAREQKIEDDKAAREQKIADDAAFAGSHEAKYQKLKDDYEDFRADQERKAAILAEELRITREEQERKTKLQFEELRIAKEERDMLRRMMAGVHVQGEQIKHQNADQMNQLTEIGAELKDVSKQLQDQSNRPTT